MIINKITSGYVVQKYDTLKDAWISQKFIACNDCLYQNENGDVIDEAIMGDPEPYLPFNMIQPEL